MHWTLSKLVPAETDPLGPSTSVQCPVAGGDVAAPKVI